MSNTKRKGNITEAVTIAEFVKLGIPVLVPFGDTERYDIVIEINNSFYKIQCKTAWINKDGNSISFATISNSNTSKIKKHLYDNSQIDFFAVYCIELNILFLLHINEISGETQTILRLVVPKNNQIKKIKLAQDYEFKNQINKYFNISS